ncbi:membrane-associated 30 kDa protein [Artemisia annua]|uniref:Membrane-associated 30 kDa protein n=1 Tax=Artemisia annua TaxID=35608 RepID=A0A2U1M684_ARTAN|nr:membrane-associated 30 kDa protein [Artemisia annua]
MGHTGNTAIMIWALTLCLEQKGELPPGITTASSSKAAYPFPDLEIENELNQLRQRTKEL